MRCQRPDGVAVNEPSSSFSHRKRNRGLASLGLLRSNGGLFRARRGLLNPFTARRFGLGDYPEYVPCELGANLAASSIRPGLRCATALR